MIRNNKGFAVTGILYAILILFLMLILLILGNFQSRKVLFDKQKENVYEKLNELKLTNEYFYSPEVQIFTTPKDGFYRLEAWGADLDSSTKGGYVKAKIKLHQGVRLFIVVGSGDIGDASIVRTERINVNTIILKAMGANGDSFYGYTIDYNPDIAINPITDYIKMTSDYPAKKISENEKDGYVKISYIRSF